LEEAQTMVMTARVALGWVDPAELEVKEEESEVDEDRELTADDVFSGGTGA
jgi:N utilization substance protein A